MNELWYYVGEKKAVSLSKPDHSCVTIQACFRKKKKKKKSYLKARDGADISVFRFSDGGYLDT